MPISFKKVWIPTISKLVTYDTSYECFDALRKGNVDAIISGYRAT